MGRLSGPSSRGLGAHSRNGAPPVERVWIEKEAGKQRPISTPCCADKLVQRAVGMILEALFAPELQAFSHGFRKGYSRHQALHELREQCRKRHLTWLVDAEVSGVVDNLAWGWRRAFLQQRGKDGGILRLIGKGLHAGVLEAGALPHPDKGAPPGAVISPMVANLFLPQVLDAWFVQDVQPRMKGRGFLTRCANDCILGCELEADARRVMEVFPKRCNRFTLTIHPEQTGLIAFTPPPGQEQSATGKGTVDVLGVPPYWAKTRRGDWVSKRKTTGKRRGQEAPRAWRQAAGRRVRRGRERRPRGKRPAARAAFWGHLRSTPGEEAPGDAKRRTVSHGHRTGPQSSVCFRPARVNLDVPWPTVILMQGTR
jgi:RNA-directed DNA polymerase